MLRSEVGQLAKNVRWSHQRRQKNGALEERIFLQRTLDTKWWVMPMKQLSYVPRGEVGGSP
jgi:hypothetical protein